MDYASNSEQMETDEGRFLGTQTDPNYPNDPNCPDQDSQQNSKYDMQSEQWMDLYDLSPFYHLHFSQPAESSDGLHDSQVASDVLPVSLQSNDEWMPTGESATLSVGNEMPTTVPTFLPNAIGTHHTSQLAPKAGRGRVWTAELDKLLLTRRREARVYTAIAEEMGTRGVTVTNNQLVKRFQLLQSQNLEPLPEAFKNVMPEIMAIVKVEVEKMGLEAMGKDGKNMLDQIMQELPREIPKFVQNTVNRKRKTLLNTSLARE